MGDSKGFRRQGAFGFSGARVSSPAASEDASEALEVSYAQPDSLQRYRVFLRCLPFEHCCGVLPDGH